MKIVLTSDSGSTKRTTRYCRVDQSGKQHGLEFEGFHTALSNDDDENDSVNLLDRLLQRNRGALEELNTGGNSRHHAPVPRPEKVICIGKNYGDHAREMGGQAPSIPVVFSKFASAIASPGQEILLPEISTKVDFEAELVVVIGRRGKNIPQSAAMDYVFGYTCGNDISARDWQKEKPGGQWLAGKSFDTFAPIGPAIVTADEIPDPGNLDVLLRLNGEIMQHGNTRDMIFPVDHLIAHVSKLFTLNPGDLIFTGTPAGVGAGRTPPVFLKEGDVLQVEIPEIGVLENRCVQETAS